LCPCSSSSRRPSAPSGTRGSQRRPTAPRTRCASALDARRLEIRNRTAGLRDFRPFSTVRSAMVGPTVILLEEGAVPGGVPGELVYALAPIRVLVREELCPHAAVLHRPAASAIPRLERSDGTDSHDEMPRVPRVDEHGVEAQPPATWLPLLPRRMVVQRIQIVPRVPAVVAAEQGRGLGARVDRVWRFRRSRFDMPDPGHGEIGALLELGEGLRR